MDKRGESSMKIFRRKFLSHCTEIFRGIILYCYLHLGYRECLDKREGGNQDIPSEILVSQCRNFL